MLVEGRVEFGYLFVLCEVVTEGRERICRVIRSMTLFNFLYASSKKYTSGHSIPSDKGAFPKSRDYFQCCRTNSLSFAVGVILQHPPVVSREVLILKHVVNAIESDLF